MLRDNKLRPLNSDPCLPMLSEGAANPSDLATIWLGQNHTIIISTSMAKTRPKPLGNQPVTASDTPDVAPQNEFCIGLYIMS